MPTIFSAGLARNVLLVLTASALLTGCDATPSLPPTSGVFDYQLGGTSDRLPTAADFMDFAVVGRDSTATPLTGAYHICYVNDIQSQLLSVALFTDRGVVLGDDRPVVDPNWPDEYVLDPSTQIQREQILDRLGPVVDGCAKDGFDAVEVDNLDTWTRCAAIDESRAHALAASYVERAHAAGLSIGQKNAAEVTQFAHDDLGFDFAVTEECAVWDQCSAYTDVYGSRVLQIEYPDALISRGVRLTTCAPAAIARR